MHNPPGESCGAGGDTRDRGGGGERLVTCGGPGGPSLDVLGVVGVGFFLREGFRGGFNPVFPPLGKSAAAALRQKCPFK